MPLRRPPGRSEQKVTKPATASTARPARKRMSFSTRSIRTTPPPYCGSGPGSTTRIRPPDDARKYRGLSLDQGTRYPGLVRPQVSIALGLLLAAMPGCLTPAPQAYPDLKEVYVDVAAVTSAGL